MAEHEAKKATGAWRFKQGAIVDGQHPVDLKREMHTGGQAEISAQIGR